MTTVAVQAAAEHAPESDDTKFLGHPRGLSTLFFTEMWERFSFYGMRAILVPFFTASVAVSGLGMAEVEANGLYAIYNSLVYLLALPGGWIADRLWGSRRCVLWGGITIACGHYAMAVPARPTVFVGLCLIALGTGFLKPNISAMVGRLYRAHDERRDAGFTVFYMAINIGAFAAPLITGWFGDSRRNEYHWGFSIAAAGMTLAVIQYVWGGRHLGDVGRHAPNPIHRAELNRVLRLAGLGLLVVAAIVVGWMLITQFTVTAFKDSLAAPIIAAPLLYFGYMFRAPGVSADERSRLGAFVFFFVGATLFWMIYDQSGSMLNLFARDKVDMNVFGFRMPFGWLQSANPLFIIIFAPLVALLWETLGNRAPRTSIKFGVAMLFIGGSFGLMGLISHWTDGGVMVTVWWLALVYLVQTIAELFLSPVGLSVTTKLAPALFAGQMLGLWFLATAVGNALNVYVTQLNPVLGNGAYYTMQGCAAAAVGICFLLFSRKINALMGDVR